MANTASAVAFANQRHREVAAVSSVTAVIASSHGGTWADVLGTDSMAGPLLRELRGARI
jgi:hypothetical protein